MKTPKTIAIITLAALALGACSSTNTAGLRLGNTRARAIAMDPNIPGKGTYGQCLPFALALHERLAAAGIPSKVVGYRYEDLQGTKNVGLNRGHAVVSYNDQGRTYLMDNQSPTPVWVESNSPLMTNVGQLEGMDVRIVSAWDVNENLAKRTASIR